MSSSALCVCVNVYPTPIGCLQDFYFIFEFLIVLLCYDVPMVPLFPHLSLLWDFKELWFDVFHLLWKILCYYFHRHFVFCSFSSHLCLGFQIYIILFYIIPWLLDALLCFSTFFFTISLDISYVLMFKFINPFLCCT